VLRDHCGTLAQARALTSGLSGCEHGRGGARSRTLRSDGDGEGDAYSRCDPDEAQAEAYAEGVGAKLGRSIRLSDPGDRLIVHGTAVRAMAMSSEPMPVESGEQEVAASIEATFVLELG
jgi:hypothetical protein